ncbi:hypothetical protein E2P81_ATG09343 [Venturia nashicola]|uniref:DUF2293 domain-containing protein n=1 Tax=Venturia nashicola TaxID=86259 RepID=A0A4Z1NQZ6_9PEZI|nr:hypothetical protein E6O75_ATG09550 [Venturia nashicola]TLD25686.1 hypothetical protein E2P81_ATG09343 [Venturia nashicola]
MSSNNHEIVVSPTTHVPKGYIFVRKGNVYLTSNCRKKTHTAGEKLYVVQDQRKRNLGIQVPHTIFASVLAAHQETKTSRQAAVAAKDARLNSKAEGQIIVSFPNIPRDMISDILRHTLKKRSGRVGRTATIPFDESINLAVRAFVRHRLTNYDELLLHGMTQNDARQKIRSRLEKIVEDWKDGTEKSKEAASTHTRPQLKSKQKRRAIPGEPTTAIAILDLTSD